MPTYAFIGREALLRQRDAGEVSRIRTIVLEDVNAVPLGNEPVYVGDKIIGKTTSAAFGYRVGRPIALADLQFEPGLQEPDTVEVDVAGVRFAGQLIDAPAFDSEGARMRQRS